MTIYSFKYGCSQKIVYDSEDKYTYCYLNKKLDKPIMLGPVTSYELFEQATEQEMFNEIRSGKKS